MTEELKEKIQREIPAEDSTSEEEKEILASEIRKRKPKVIVEIGTHRGMTTLYMAEAALEVGAHIHTCDPDESWGQVGNFRKFPEFPNITYYPVKGKDLDVSNIDFIFCDGFHEKVYVIEELEHFLPRLNDGGVIYFHDTAGSNIHCDVPGAIDEKGLKVTYLQTLNGMAVYEHNQDKRNNSLDTNVGTRGNAKKSRKPNV